MNRPPRRQRLRVIDDFPREAIADDAELRDIAARSLSPAKQAPRELPGLSLLLTADETAALLRTTRKAVYAMAERGSLPGVVRIGRRLLVRRDVLLESLSERRAASPGGSRR
jgi:excisionase family DNA binding protein